MTAPVVVRDWVGVDAGFTMLDATVMVAKAKLAVLKARVESGVEVERAASALCDVLADLRSCTLHIQARLHEGILEVRR